MAPSAIEVLPIDSRIKDFVVQKKDTLALPATARARLDKAGIDLSNGYPERPAKPLYLQDAIEIRNEDREHIDAGARADKSKSALFSAAKEVKDLTKHIGTEIIGLQLKDLTDQQRDELALLIAERSVVFFRDQDLTPQDQKKLGEHFGEVEIHPQVPHVPGVPGVTIIVSRFVTLLTCLGEVPWNQSSIVKIKYCLDIKPLLALDKNEMYTDNHSGLHYKQRKERLHSDNQEELRDGIRTHLASDHDRRLTSRSDLVHEKHPAGITHLHNDTVPSIGGDTLWASGYAAYSKLSPEFRKIIDGRKAIYTSAHTYLDRNDPNAGPKHIERIHPIVRVHPATGWKSLFVNRAMTKSIVGLDKKESDLILNYLYDVYESNVDIQVRFNWTPRTSALWDNRITIHNASWDYEGSEPRHGTRVTSLAEKPYFVADAPTRREALGLPDN